MNHKLIILQFSYWEHFKLNKDLALILPHDHWRRKELTEIIDKLQKEMHDMKNEE
jgi:hypothetical protein